MADLSWLVLLLSAFYIATSRADDSRSNCTIASFNFNRAVCKYVVPSLLCLLVVFLVTIIVLACKLLGKRHVSKGKGNEMTISEVLPYAGSSNIHTIATNPSPICDATSTAIEIKPVLPHSASMEQLKPSSKTFLGENDYVDKTTALETMPSPSAPLTVPKNPNHKHPSKPMSIYMSLKRFIPSSRPTLTAFRHGRRNSKDYADVEQNNYEVYDDTVERVPQNDTSEKYVDMAQYSNCKQDKCAVMVKNAQPDRDNNFIETKQHVSLLATKSSSGVGRHHDALAEEGKSCQPKLKVETLGKERQKLMRDYVNVSPSNPNDSAANCSYAFPQLRSFPNKLWGLKKGKITLSPASYDV